MSSYRIRVGPKSKESETHRHSDEGCMRVKAEIGVTQPTLPQGAPGRPEAGEAWSQFSLGGCVWGEVALMTPWFWTSSLWNCERLHCLWQP